MLTKQHLSAASRARNTASVIRDLVGLHATDPLSPYLQLRARVIGFDPGKLDRLLDDGRAAKLSAMRGTLFIEIVIDSRVAGVWDLVREPRQELRVFLFAQVGVSVHRKVIKEAADLGQFVAGEAVPVVDVHGMRPLAERAGSRERFSATTAAPAGVPGVDHRGRRPDA